MPENPIKTIGLLANRRMRKGPDSPLARFIRRFEPYLRDVLKPKIYAVEGTYRALLRYGLLHDYQYLECVPAGYEGGIVNIAAKAVRAEEQGGASADRIDMVIYLIDPQDPTSLFPESLALKRDCVVAGKTFVPTYSGACEWLALQWYTTDDPSVQRYFLNPPMLEKLLPDASKGVANQTIALIAHDRKKKELLKFAREHLDFLQKFKLRLATGTTGTLLNGIKPGRLAEEMEKDEGLRSEFDQLCGALQEKGIIKSLFSVKLEFQSDFKKSQLSEGFRQKFEKKGISLSPDVTITALEEGRSWQVTNKGQTYIIMKGDEALNIFKSWVNPETSGPRGGDVQIAEKIRNRECDKVIFFEDPHVAREHEADIQLLERTARMAGIRVTCLHDYNSATGWARNWEECINKGMPNPITISHAYRELFEVELVVANQGWNASEKDKEEIWQNILTKAAWYIVGLVVDRAHDKLTVGDKVRVAVTWGPAMHEMIKALSKVPEKLKKLDKELKLSPPLAEERFLKLPNVLALPTFGMIGTPNPHVEANGNAARLASFFGGEHDPLPYSAFIEKDLYKDISKDLSRWQDYWDRLDIAIFACDRVRESFGIKAIAPMPPGLYRQMKDAAVGEIGGMFLNDKGDEVEPDNYVRVGISHRQLKEVAKQGGAILIAGVQEDRLAPVLAALRGRLVSVLVTDLDFAWKVLELYAREAVEVST